MQCRWGIALESSFYPSRTGIRLLADVLTLRVEEDADRIAYEILIDGQKVLPISYGELYQRVAATIEVLMASTSRSAVGNPALIAYPPGADYVIALWACIAAGVPAVPVSPPGPDSGGRSLDRLVQIAADSQARCIFVPPDLHDITSEVIPAVHPVATLTEGSSDIRVGESARCSTRVSDVAIIQYTSGTTGTPRGVAVGHTNLIDNIRRIAELFQVDGGSSAVSWLPPYHDMGLVGGILTPLFVGFPVRLIAPFQFLKSPIMWLKQISQMNASVSGGPNFAYDLVLRHCQDSDIDDLDLSSWRVAFNGAETVRRETLEAFGSRFLPAGFNSASFLPCYGLAEATLLVAGTHWQREPDSLASQPVGCGPVIPGHELCIVDSHIGQPVPQGCEGEVWVRGPSVCQGYWRGPGERAGGECFGELNGKLYLRTGDMGVLNGEDLTISGRIKELIIRRGVNYYAHEIEHAATAGDTRLRPIAAAFMIEHLDSEPTIVAIVESAGAEGSANLAEQVRERVLGNTGLSLDVVVVVPARVIPRTGSGKLQRQLCKELFVAGAYDAQIALGAWPPVREAGDMRPGVQPPDDIALTAEFSQFLAGVFCAVCNTSDRDLTKSLAALGGDSLQAAQIASVIEHGADVAVSVELVLSAARPSALAEALLTAWAERGMEVREMVDKIVARAAEKENK
jgi:acyl-CoA synthetase (AMP-forming)/AMP-acid ligase II